MEKYGNRNFFKSLRCHAHKFEWNVNTKNQIRGKIGNISFCPVTAVYFARTGKKVNIQDVYQADSIFNTIY
jgi:hypothetical protein